MKKTVLFTCVASALLAPDVSAQQLVPKWRAVAAGNAANRDMEYNPATGNLLVVRSGAILRFQSSDGTSAGANLNVSGVSGGTLSLGGISVTRDGVVYACNYATSTSGPFKLYRWDDEDSAPTMIFSTATTGLAGGVGVGLNIYEEGTNVHFVTSGTTTNALYVYHDGTDWASKVLTFDNLAMVSGASFVDFNNNETGEFRILAKTGQTSGRIFAFNPATASPITLTTNRTYLTAPLTYSLNGVHAVDYDPVTGLIGAQTRVAGTTFLYTNILVATKGGVGTNLFNPVELSRESLVATGTDGGAVGAVSWGTDGRLYTSPAAVGAGLHAYDITAFVVSGPADLTKSIGESAAFTAVVAGSELSYQWKKGETILADDAKYSGTTSATLTINDLVAEDADTYTLTVAGVASSSASASATLTISGGTVPATITGIEIIGGVPVLTFQGTPNATHYIHARSSLSDGWQEIGTVAAPASGTFEYSDESANGIPVRFYRSAQ